METKTSRACEIEIGYHPDGYRIDKTASAILLSSFNVERSMCSVETIFTFCFFVPSIVHENSTYHDQIAHGPGKKGL